MRVFRSISVPPLLKLHLPWRSNNAAVPQKFANRRITNASVFDKKVHGPELNTLPTR